MPNYKDVMIATVPTVYGAGENKVCVGGGGGVYIGLASQYVWVLIPGGFALESLSTPVLAALCSSVSNVPDKVKHHKSWLNIHTPLPYSRLNTTVCSAAGIILSWWSCSSTKTHTATTPPYTTHC